MRYIFFLFISPVIIWAFRIEYSDISITTFESSNKASKYTLTAKYHKKKFSKKSNLLLLFNTEQYMLENFYYQNGMLKTLKSSLSYQKAYILGRKVYLYDVNGSISNMIIKARKVEYDGEHNYLLHSAEIIKSKKILRRTKYLIDETKQ